jgi:hypothetical protein
MPNQVEVERYQVNGPRSDISPGAHLAAARSSTTVVEGRCRSTRKTTLPLWRCDTTVVDVVTGSATDDDGATYDGTTTPPFKDDATVVIKVTTP